MNTVKITPKIIEKYGTKYKKNGGMKTKKK
jgi:hypothetical protein